MDPKGAQAVLAVFSQSAPEITKANIDLSKTYTNQFVEAAQGKIAADRCIGRRRPIGMRRGTCSPPLSLFGDAP